MLINSYFKKFLEEKIGFRKIKSKEMIVFGSLIYHYLVCVHLNFFPFLGGNYIPVLSIVLCVYIMQFLKKKF